MDWTGDLGAFDRAAVDAQDVAAFTRALRRVPHATWRVVYDRLRAELDAVRSIPDAENPEGRESTSTTVLSEELIRRAEVLDAKERALRDEDAARRGGAVRPA
jgi:hypothetical protein